MVGRNLVLIAVTGGSLRHEACDRHLMQKLGNLEYDVPRKKKVLAVDIDVIESETLLKLNPMALQFFQDHKNIIKPVYKFKLFVKVVLIVIVDFWSTWPIVAILLGE